MSIIDKLLSFDDGATVTGGTTTVAVDHIDLGLTVPGRKLGSGRPLWLVIHVTAVSGGDGADTFTFSLVTDTALPIDGSSVVVAAAPTITGVANIPAGTRIVIPVPPGVEFSRYVGVRYAVTADAVLTVDAFLTDQEQYDHTAYADGTTDWDA